jgi:integrase
VRGSIRQRTPGGSYTAYWFTTDPGTGKRRQHTAAFRTKGEASKHLNSVPPKVDAGTWKPDQPLTVRQLLIEHWLPAQRTRELRTTTLAQYQGVIDHWVVPQLGGLKVAELTPRTVTDYMTALRTEPSAHGRPGLSARSVQLAVGVLKAACAWAVEAELVGRNPVASVRRPRSQSHVMKVWAPDETRAFIASVREDRLYAAWALFLGRGLRRGEVCGLRWDAVDIEAGRLAITATRVLTEGGQVVSSRPKTDAGVRRISLDAHLVATLRAHRRRQLEERLRAGEAYQDSGFVFTDELGTAYYPDTFSERFDRLVAKAGLPRIRLHDARHTCATSLAAGEPVKVVQEMLGHASPTITLGVYAHVLPGMAESAGERLSARLFGSSES